MKASSVGVWGNRCGSPLAEEEIAHMDMGFEELKEVVGRFGEDAQVFASNVSESCR
jgi:hypothetical protein